MESKKWQDKKVNPIRLLLVYTSILLILGGAIAWIFAERNVGTILSAAFTVAGVILSLLQISFPRHPSTDPVSLEDEAYSIFIKQAENEISTNQDKGLLVIYAIPEMKGKQIDVLDLQTQTLVTSATIVRHMINDHPIYAAEIFLQPGSYVVQSPSAPSNLIARSIVRANSSKVTPIIWRTKNHTR